MDVTGQPIELCNHKNSLLALAELYGAGQLWPVLLLAALDLGQLGHQLCTGVSVQVGLYDHLLGVQP